MFRITEAVTDVALQDQTTPPIIANFNLLEQETTLTSVTAIGDVVVDVTSATGISAGKYLTIFDIISDRYFLSTVLSVSTLAITIDTPLDFAFPIGASVSIGEKNLAVDGATTTQVFGLRNTESAVGVTFDITRIIFTALTVSACDLSLFGDLTALTNGLVLRTKNGVYNNIFTVKTNGEFANIMYDFQILASLNPIQGQDGFIGRLTFAGSNKIGVALRIDPGDDLQVLVQDTLNGVGGLTSFNVIAEGHEVYE